MHFLVLWGQHSLVHWSAVTRVWPSVFLGNQAFADVCLVEKFYADDYLRFGYHAGRRTLCLWFNSGTSWIFLRLLPRELNLVKVCIQDGIVVFLIVKQQLYF